MLVISAVGIAAFGWFVVRQALRGEMAAWIPGFLVGGALSNVADRVIGGSVRDFVATAPVVWNVADVAVVVGLVGYSCARLARPRPARGGEAT
jgi:lipoprotein signal peptidase